MKYFYAAATMGFDSNGYWWHRYFNFPKFQTVTKTVTLDKKIGYPFAIIHLYNSIWNHVGLHNKGIVYWLNKQYNPNTILSIAGTDSKVQVICDLLEEVELAGIELNFSCPNVEHFANKRIPISRHKLQLKLNCYQDPYQFDLSKIERISLNSIPGFAGGLSGKLAQKKNWNFIKKFRREGLPIAGCSITRAEDIKKLEDLGCNEVALGSILLTNPWLVQNLRR